MNAETPVEGGRDYFFRRGKNADTGLFEYGVMVLAVSKIEKDRLMSAADAVGGLIVNVAWSNEDGKAKVVDEYAEYKSRAINDALSPQKEIIKQNTLRYAREVLGRKESGACILQIVASTNARDQAVMMFDTFNDALLLNEALAKSGEYSI